MPIYVYRCTNCGLEKEILQKISEPPAVLCLACQQPTLTKQVTAAGFQLKGSGWYETDFKTKSAPKMKEEAGQTGADKNNKSKNTLSDERPSSNTKSATETSATE